MTDPPATRWGDREQRRRDILDAARRHIETDGYLSLNMRDLATSAGISPATLYSYFANKEELFARLYAEAIRAHTDRLRPIADASHGLTPLIDHLLAVHVDLYRAYGRHFTLWSALRQDDRDHDRHPMPRDLIVELRSASIEHNRLLMSAVRAAAARDGRKVADDRLVPSLLWSMLNGVADHVVSERRTLDPYPIEELVTFAAHRIALAITDPTDRGAAIGQ